MTILTYLYGHVKNEACNSHEFFRSCDEHGYTVLNVIKAKKYMGHAQVFREIGNAIQDLSGPIVYADAADSFFLRPINVPTDKILYSTEKAYWEPIGGEERYTDKKSRWCYLNGGGWCGPAELVKEFYERYALASLTGPAQMHQHNAFFAAKADGFPIELDQLCTEFQTIAFREDDEFSTEGGVLKNLLTTTTPALIHGNGQTPMGWVYDLMP